MKLFIFTTNTLNHSIRQNWLYVFLAKNVCGFLAWTGLNSEFLVLTRYSEGSRLLRSFLKISNIYAKRKWKLRLARLIMYFSRVKIFSKVAWNVRHLLGKQFWISMKGESKYHVPVWIVKNLYNQAFIFSLRLYMSILIRLGQ